MQIESGLSFLDSESCSDHCHRGVLQRSRMRERAGVRVEGDELALTLALTLPSLIAMGSSLSRDAGEGLW